MVEVYCSVADDFEYFCALGLGQRVVEGVKCRGGFGWSWLGQMKRWMLWLGVFAALFFSVVAVKMYQSGAYAWTFWFEGGALHAAGPARMHPRSEEARQMTLECQDFDEQWAGRPINNPHEHRMRQADFEACSEGMTRTLRNLDRDQRRPGWRSDR